MNLFNVGGGEILFIIILALVMFGPKDIMNIMRTVGRYTRAAGKAWAQISAALRGELLPEEVQEVVEDTRGSMKEVQETLHEIGETVKETQQSINEDVKDLDKPLQVQMPNLEAEVKAEIEARKAKHARHTQIQDPGVQEILTMFEKTSPSPKKPSGEAEAAPESLSETGTDSSHEPETEPPPEDAAATPENAPTPAGAPPLISQEDPNHGQ